MTRALIDEGFAVTAVDNSEEMLESVPNEARVIRADIGDLDIGERFDTVLLASCLINVADESTCAKWLDSCRRHLLSDGLFAFERHDPAWLLNARPGYIGSIGSITMHLESEARQGDIARLCVRYEDESSVWHHNFSVRALDDAAVNRLLRKSGFGAAAWLNERVTWGLARPQNAA
jgi:hypothetical protein